MLPSLCGSTAASWASWRQRLVVRRRSAVASPFTYLSNQAVAYQSISSAPRSVAGKPRLGVERKARGGRPRMMNSAVPTPALEYAFELTLLGSGAGSDRLG